MMDQQTNVILKQTVDAALAMLKHSSGTSVYLSDKDMVDAFGFAAVVMMRVAHEHPDKSISITMQSDKQHFKIELLEE